MSVKLLAGDAKLLLTQKVENLRKLLERGKGMEQSMSGDMRLQSINLRRLIGEIEASLKSPDNWDRDDTDPGIFIAPAPTLKTIFGREMDGMILLCGNAFFQVKGPYSEEEAKLLVREKLRKIRSQVDYLKFRTDGHEIGSQYERLPISDEVRNMVWRRDEGKCVQCGSSRNLEFDHIIPVSKGGKQYSQKFAIAL
jgi:hypothetical protein